jgi:lambda family phage tail tape measure protein
MADLLNIAVEFASVRAAAQAMQSLNTLTATQAERAAAATAEAATMGRTLTAAQANAAATAQRTTAALNLQTAAVSAVVTGFAEYTKMAIQTNLELDRMNQLMKYSSDTVSVNGKGMSTFGANLEFVREEANKLGLGIMEATNAFGKLSAATEGTKLQGEKTKEIFTALAAVNSQLGGSNADLAGMMNAVTQMASKGVVQLEELRGQLGDRLPGAVNLAALAMNRTTGELMNMISNGELLASDFLPKLSKVLYTSSEDVDRLTKTINGVSEESKNSVATMQGLQKMFGEDMPTAMKMYSESTGKSTEEVKKLIESGNILVKDLLPNMIDQLGKVDTTFDTTAANMNRLDNAWTRFKQNLSDNSWSRNIISGATQALNALNALTNASIDEQIQNKQRNIASYQDSPEMVQGLRTLGGYNIDKEKQDLEKLLNQKKDHDKTVETITKAENDKAAKVHDEANAGELKRAAALHQQMNIQTLTANAKSIEDKRKVILALAEVDKQKAVDDVTKAKLTGEQLNKAVEDLYLRKQSIDAKAAADIDALDAKDAAKAERKAEASAKRAERQQAAMHERSLDLMAQYSNTVGILEAKADSNTIEGLDKLAEAKKRHADEQLRNAHLTGQALINGQKQLSEVYLAIEDQTLAAQNKLRDKRDKENMLAAKSENRYIGENMMTIAKINDDRIQQQELTSKAELKILKDKYDEEVKIAQKAGRDISNITESYNKTVEAKQSEYSKKTTRLSGGYTDNLMLDLHERFQSQINISKEMADVTMNAADQVASGLAEMAVRGKMSLSEMAVSVIQSIEMMIAKMIIMKTISLALGGLGGMFGGATSGIQSAGTASLGQATSAGSMSAAITPSFASFQAEGGMWNNGVQMFAEGGVVNAPTLFNHSGGYGLMGEAGPEAIVPLSKGRSIPVEITGGQSSKGISVGNVNIVIQSKNNKPSEDGQDAAKAFQAQMRAIAKQEISNSTRVGNRLNPVAVR